MLLVYHRCDRDPFAVSNSTNSSHETRSSRLNLQRDGANAVNARGQVMH